MTGSRVAGALARIPVELMAKLHVDKWEKHAFMGKLIMSTWIDNFFVMARSLRGGMEVMQDAETYLRNRWNLSFKASSKMVMLPKDHAEEEDAEGWTHCICLGAHRGVRRECSIVRQ